MAAGRRQARPGSVALIGLVNPVVATALGVVLAGETFGAVQALCLGGVVAGRPGRRWAQAEVRVTCPVPTSASRPSSASASAM